MTKRRVGLVLEGGGAKGAYQMGALKKFAEHGITFDCVAGTSVGGLNAALWAAGKLKEGEELWSTLRQDKIYPWRMPIFIGYPAAIAIFVLSLVVHYLDGAIPLKISAGCRLALAIVGVGLAIAGYVFWHGTLAGLSTIFVGLAMASIGTLSTSPGHLKSIFTAWLAIPGFFAFMSAAFYIFYYIPDGRLRNVLLFAFVVLFPASLALAGRLSVALLARFGRAVVVQNVLDSAPLRQEVDRILRGARLSIPVYVTAAERRYLLDPDDIHEVQKTSAMIARLAGVTAGADVEMQPFVRRRFVPHYLCVSEFDHPALVDALMATAALPLGIVSAVSYGELTFVDGGMVDNCPLLPVISWCQCEEIVVISLKPTADRSHAGDERRCQELQRLLDLSRLTWDDPAKLRRLVVPTRNDPPVECPFRAIEPWPRIHYLAPPRTLGNFMTGTLNFTQAYARSLMERGYQDAERFLAAFDGAPEADAPGAQPATL